MFPSQSNTFNLLQPPPVPHDPLLLHPAGIPPFLSCPVEQLPHAIVYIFSQCLTDVCQPGFENIINFTSKKEWYKYTHLFIIFFCSVVVLYTTYVLYLNFLDLYLMVALITGATSGIGRSTAVEFAKNGYDVIITGRRQERLMELKDMIAKEYQVRVLDLCFDVRDEKQVEKAIHSIPGDFKRIDVLVNNAGLAAGLSGIQDGQLNHWEQMIDTNVKGLLYVSKHVSKILIENKNGHIINIGSIAGKEVYANGNVYCATKHAVDALNKGMRIDLLHLGIRVSSVNPGMVETEFSVVRFEGDEERAKKVYDRMVPLKPEDVAETIYWIASRPAHVNINDVIIMPTVQANSTTVLR
jgi:NADP-dependent 3-hydroxy acid dehydrogenase YdfG